MTLKSFLLFCFIISLTLSSNSQTITPASIKLVNLIESLSCRNDSCFDSFMEASGYVYNKSEKIENGTIHYFNEPTVFNLYGKGPEKKEFSAYTNLSDGYIYIINLSTRDKSHRNALIKEMSILGFNKTDDKNQSPQSPNGVSYKSIKYQNYKLMYFESKEENIMVYTFNVLKLPK